MLHRLKTDRLILRAFSIEDAPRVQAFVGHKRIAEMTANIPHPYKNGMAEAWINQHAEWLREGKAIIYAVTLADTGELIGAVSANQMTEQDANLGYWLGIPYWGQGYCTEATQALINLLFNTMKHPMIYAQHLLKNSASEQVIKKCGFSFISIREVNIAGQKRLVKYYELHNKPHQAAYRCT